MIKLDNMLMIGSAGANVGKTELACAILRKHSKNRKIVGIKVTAVQEKNGQCPRGGTGCGVCSSLEGVFCITEEKSIDTDKDTSRLLAAGADSVFWLQVLKEHLLEGVTALLDMIGPDAVSICESNSLRQVVEPGLFLMAISHESRSWKDSARKVKHYADRIVVSDGEKFDLDISLIELIGDKWELRPDCKPAKTSATAIIMAGGASSRMGNDKTLLPVNGRPMIERVCDQLRGHFDQILISANEPDKLAFLGLEVVPDEIPGEGPLMGVASALEASSSELNFIVACDIPHIDIGCIEEMLALADRSGADMVVPVTGKDKFEPLFAVYRKSVLEAARKLLASGGRKITDIFALCKVKYIDLHDADWLINLNTRAEYEKFTKEHSDKF